jgi:serine phosphatase RsbU (regulator of sigma subunit)
MLAAVQGMPLVIFVAQWLVTSLFAATISWALLIFFLRRRLKSLSVHRGPLFAALLLVTVAAANLYIEGRTFALHDPLVAAPAQVLFLIFFYIYPDSSYAGTGVRWLGIIYTFSQVATYLPQQKSNQPELASITHVPSLLGTVMVVGSAAALGPIVIGILPQLYARSRRLALLGSREPTPVGRQIALVGCGGGASAVMLLGAGALSLPPALPDIVRIAYFLLASLVPVGLGFALLSGRHYDAESLLHRALIGLAVVACLLLVYGAGIVAMNLIFPGNSGSGSGYLPFVLLIGALLTAIYPPVHAQAVAFIGRRFFRETYTAGQILSAANRAWRGETRPDQLCAQVMTAIEKALQPVAVALWVRQPPGAAGLRPAVIFTSSASSLSSLPSAEASAPEAERAPLPPDVTQLRLYPGVSNSTPTNAATLVLRPDDPAGVAFQRPASVVEVDRLPENSPIASVLRASAMGLALPLVSQGNLEGVLALSSRPGARPFGDDVREMLATLAVSAAPALATARIAHQQDVEARARERVEQELQMARRIQESLLPKQTPELAGWQLATCYQPAREVGGDFYDFIALDNGRLGIVLGDVTDKGIPAALVMATTRSMLRAVATQPAVTPGMALAQVNMLLCADLPPGMFVTCFYSILDQATGRLHYANAGQDLPYVRQADGGVSELWARGMPLGLMTGMAYEEQELTLALGDELLFYSDGLVEAHSPQREMFGFPRLMALLGDHASSAPAIEALLNALANFTGPDWEQEDDITLVVLQRLQHAEGK